VQDPEERDSKAVALHVADYSQAVSGEKENVGISQAQAIEHHAAYGGLLSALSPPADLTGTG
jgi:hypothetical protein